MEKAKRFHLVGIGGVGMSALADALLDCGHGVTGSDRFNDTGAELPSISALKARGVRVFRQDGEGVTPGTSFVVASAAIEPDNRDLAAARERGVPICARAEALKRITDAGDLVAVAGTCGKSTTTAMLGHILSCAGMRPSVINGAAVTDWIHPGRVGSVLAGDNRLFVAEVDESDKSLLIFRPRHAIILNASADHFPLEEMNDVFDEFKRNVSGIVIDGRDGADDTAPPAVSEGEWSCGFEFDGARISLPIPGRHNGVDAWMAARMARKLGVATAQIREALAAFHGVSRRLEKVGRRSNGAFVVDDYGHNTEKIRAAITALQGRSERVIALWRPHGYGPLRKMMGDLTRMFDETLRDCDQLLLLPVFDAGGTAARSVASDELAQNLAARNKRAQVVGSHADAIRAISAMSRSGDAIAVLGARDPELSVTARAIASM